MFVRICPPILALIMASHAAASVPLGGNRKGSGGSYDLYGCMQSNDYYVVNFAAYPIGDQKTQDKQTLPEAECIDIPGLGKTQLTIDLLDLDVRKKPVALKVIDPTGQVLAETPMAIVKQGVLSTRVDFKAAGQYQVIVTVDDYDLHTPLQQSALQIPITVGVDTSASKSSHGLWILASGLLMLLAGLAYWLPRMLQSPAASTEINPPKGLL
jgi:hypothetical protein